VYYNKNMFAKQNIAVPTTLAGFTDAMAKFKSAGITPLAESAAEYPLGQLWYQLMLSKASRAFVNSYQLYKGPVNWQGPEISYATSTIKDWVNRATSARMSPARRPRTPARASSAASTRSSTPAAGGTTGSPTEATSFKWGTFLFPGNHDVTRFRRQHVGGPGEGTEQGPGVQVHRHHDEPAIQALMGNSGGVTGRGKDLDITAPSSKLLIDNFNVLTQRDGIGFYPDWPTPTFYDQLNAGLQELVNGTSRSRMSTPSSAPSTRPASTASSKHRRATVRQQ